LPVRRPEAGGSEAAWLTAPPIALGARIEPEWVAPALGLGREDLDPDLPVQHVMAGIEFVATRSVSFRTGSTMPLPR